MSAKSVLKHLEENKYPVFFVLVRNITQIVTNFNKCGKKSEPRKVEHQTYILLKLRILGSQVRRRGVTT